MQIHTVKLVHTFTQLAENRPPASKLELQKGKSHSLLSQLSSVGCLPELEELTFSRMSLESSAALAIFLYFLRDLAHWIVFAIQSIVPDSASGIARLSSLRWEKAGIPKAVIPNCVRLSWWARAKSLKKLTILFSYKCESTSLLSQLSSVGCLPELEELTFSRMSLHPTRGE
jgi:hypothetical protein